MSRRFIIQIGIISIIVIAYVGGLFLYKMYVAWQLGPPILEKPETPLKVPLIFNGKIGIIAHLSEISDVETLAEIAEKNIQTFLTSIERDESYAFSFHIEGIENGNYVQHLEKIQLFKSISFKFVVGGFSEREVMGSSIYATELDMILFSPEATINRSLYQDQYQHINFFSLIPNTTTLMSSITDAIFDYGIKGVITIESKDEQESKNIFFFSEAYRQKGGSIIGSLSSDTRLQDVENLASRHLNDFSNNQIGILSYNPSEYLQDLRNHPTISNITWISLSQGYIGSTENWKEYGIGFNLLSFQPTYIDSVKWNDLNGEFLSKTGRKLNYEFGNLYDVLWLYCLTFLETDGDFDATLAKIPAVSQQFRGVTGDCSLNSGGDRKSLPLKLIMIGNNHGLVEFQ